MRLFGTSTSWGKGFVEKIPSAKLLMELNHYTAKDMLNYIYKEKKYKVGDSVSNEIKNLCKAVRSFPLLEGKNETELPYLSIYLSKARKVEMPQIENLFIYLVLDGSIRLYTPSGIMDYLPGQYSISKIDTPVSHS